jgi:hypothetical protein
MQQFDGAPGIRITVEYGPDRMLKAVRLAPPDYDPHQIAPSTTMDPAAVAAVAAFFVPTAQRDRMSSRSQCGRGNPKVCTHTETDDEFVTTTRLPDSKVGQGDFVVTIASEHGLVLSSTAFQARFGPPVAEEFTADISIGLTATYDTASKVAEVYIAAFQSLLDPTVRPRNLPALAIDRILDEMVPLSQRTGEVREMVESSGVGSLTSVQFDNVRISRVTVGDLVQNATVRWGPRQLRGN